jgi:small-conductance mechanosensitive channel
MDLLRDTLIKIKSLLEWMPSPVVASIILIVAALLALLLHAIFSAVARRVLSRKNSFWYPILQQMRGLTRTALLVFMLTIAVPVAPIPPDISNWLARLLLIAFIALVGWGILTGLRVGSAIYLRGYRLDVEDNLLARKHVTQVRVLLRALDVLVIVVTVAAALMTFEPVRQYGVSLFASAGVAGIIVGLAARPVLSNLFAGVQLAMTQPIRLDDAVVVENEYGTIEEITSTYVVVKLWDLRRMIVPLSYFIEKPFQNWTRERSALIGNVLLYLDYRAPIAAMREKLKEIVKNSPDWDGEVCKLQVTDTKQQTIEVRCLMSAPSAGSAFTLRCEVREKMIDFLQREHPEALPHQRSGTFAEEREIEAGKPARRLAGQR